MFRALATSSVRAVMRNHTQRCLSTSATLNSKPKLSDEEFDAKFLDFFNRKDMDGYELRNALQELHGHDLVPEPKLVSAALHACRRVDDLALAVRFLETVKFKCGPHVKKIWPYMTQEIRPTLDELGIPLPEDIGYDKPENAVTPEYMEQVRY